VYRLTLDPVAEEQITAVSSEALVPLAELFTLLETAPTLARRVNGTRIVTPFRHVNVDPLRLIDLYSSVGPAVGTRPRSRSLSR
jgi:hypothetical protein